MNAPVSRSTFTCIAWFVNWARCWRFWGVDAIVFTGGVGENSPDLRARVCHQLNFTGLRLDAAKKRNPTLDAQRGSSDSRVPVLVIRAQEEWEIARECYHLAHALRVPSV